MSFFGVSGFGEGFWGWIYGNVWNSLIFVFWFDMEDKFGGGVLEVLMILLKRVNLVVFGWNI